MPVFSAISMQQHVLSESLLHPGVVTEAPKVPLCTWFRAMYHLTQSKGGISSIELGRRLGVTQTTAWKIKHKLMQAMMERDATKRLTGRIEIDDAYLGGDATAASGAAVRLARRRSWRRSKPHHRASQSA